MDIILPYLPLLLTLVTITVNVILGFKGANLLTFVILNILLLMLGELLGASSLNFIGDVLAYIVELIVDLFKSLIDMIF